MLLSVVLLIYYRARPGTTEHSDQILLHNLRLLELELELFDRNVSEPQNQMVLIQRQGRHSSNVIQYVIEKRRTLILDLGMVLPMSMSYP